MVFVFFIIFCAFGIVGCSRGIDQQLISNIAEIREFVLVGETEHMSVSLMCGKRERDYKQDGEASDLIEFGVITITIDNIHLLDISDSRYVLFEGTEKFDGVLIQNPFDKSLVADTGKIIDRNENISIDIYIGNNKSSLKLKEIDSEWTLSSMDCIDILKSKYKNELKSFLKDEFEGELYIKIMNDSDKYGSDYYYYVYVIGRNKSSINMIISPKTGEILASSSNIF